MIKFANAVLITKSSYEPNQSDLSVIKIDPNHFNNGKEE